MNKNRFWQNFFSFCAISLATILITLLISNRYRSLAETEEVHWEYGGASNSSRWGQLSPEFESCKLGSNQSPINIDSYQEGETAEIKFNYQPSTVEVVDNGHTISVNYESGSTVSINNEEYELVQFHFHTPSEHTIDNEASAMEIHFVHENDAGKLAVVGVLVNSGAENELISRIWSAMPEGNKANKTNSISLNAANLLPSKKTYLSYEGSLTTPPCSEGVSWNLLLEPIELSPEQIATFGKIYQYNARPVQPLNGRSVQLNGGNTSGK